MEFVVGKFEWSKSEIVYLLLYSYLKDDEERQNVLFTGADLIVIKGLPGGKLVTEIEKFLRPERLDNSMKKDSEDEFQNQEQE